MLLLLLLCIAQVRQVPIFRHSVVKEMWALIKARGLQDPKNKKFMLVEEDMMPIFKTKRILTFGNKFCYS